MPRQKRDEKRPRRGDKRKTMFTTGWHRDPRFRFLPLYAKELYRVLWDLAREEMRETLPPRFTVQVLADEVGSGVTPDQMSEALELLCESVPGEAPLIEYTSGVGIKVSGIKTVHAALEAWKDGPVDDTSQVQSNTPSAANGESIPIDSNRNDSICTLPNPTVQYITEPNPTVPNPETEHAESNQDLVLQEYGLGGLEVRVIRDSVFNLLIGDRKGADDLDQWSVLAREIMKREILDACWLYATLLDVSASTVDHVWRVLFSRLCPKKGGKHIDPKKKFVDEAARRLGSKPLRLSIGEIK